MTGTDTGDKLDAPTRGFEIRRARSDEELRAAVQLRHEVFCVEQGVPVREELDGRDNQGVHLVAVDGDELVATCRIVMVGTTAQFSRLAVRATARRRGIATALLEQMIDRAGEEQSYTLEVRPSNLGAIALYERFGFRSAGTRRRYYRDTGEDAVIMWRTAEATSTPSPSG